MKNVLAKLDAVLGLLREAKQGIGSSYNVENEHDMANALSLLTRIGHAEYQLYEIMSLVFVAVLHSMIQKWKKPQKDAIVTERIRAMKKLINLLAIVVTLSATAYCETGNPTASGVMPQVGHCAVDKISGQWIPFGTIVRIKGLGTYKVTDRFGAGHNNRVDLFMESYEQCIDFGRQDREAEVELP